MRGGWGRGGGTHVCAPRPVSLPRRPSVPGAQAQLGALRLALGGRGPQQAPDWPLLAARTNQRPGRGPRPVSRTPRCSLVSSQPVVKATGALKISFKEPPPGGARRVVMTTGPQGPRRAFPTAPTQQQALAQWRGGGGRGRCHLGLRPAGGMAASSLGLPSKSRPHLLLGSPTHCPHESLRTNPQTHQSTIFLLPFCKRYKKIQRSRKNVNLPLQPYSLEMPAILVYVDIQVWYVYRFWHQNV